MVALSVTLRSEGATKCSMIGIGGGAIVNSVLTPLFIFGFHMGIAGAAWATVGANAYSLSYFISVFLRGKSKLSISPRDFKPSREIYVNILKFGVPMACNNVLQSFAGILCNRVGAGFGDYVVAGYGISHRLYQITYSLNFGFCLGYQPFAAYNYGAGNYKRLLSAFKVSLIYSTCIGSFMAVIFAVFPGTVMGVFTTDQQVIDVGAKMLVALAMAAPFLGCQNTFMYTLQGVDLPSRSMIISIGRQGLHIPAILLFSGLFGLSGFMLAQPLSELTVVLVGALITIPVVVKIRKGTWEGKKKRVKQETA
jgi:putative MATE family efflux protein